MNVQQAGQRAARRYFCGWCPTGREDTAPPVGWIRLQARNDPETHHRSGMMWNQIGLFCSLACAGYQLDVWMVTATEQSQQAEDGLR